MEAQIPGGEPDPFEATGNGSALGNPSLPPSQVREGVVLQAVKFLADPRVQAANPQRAIDFLRGKSMTEAEVREAFKRASLPYPNTPVGQQGFIPIDAAQRGNVVVLPPGAQLRVGPQRQGSSWASWFWGVTVAVAVLAAAREFLRRYLVPLYFPEAERRPEEQRRRETSQIGELRESVRLLVQSTRDTNDRVERLSMTLSSSGVLGDGGAADGTSRNISRTVSESIGSLGKSSSRRSRGVLERLDELREEIESLKLLSSEARSNGAFDGAEDEIRNSAVQTVDEFYTPMQNHKSGRSLNSGVGSETRLQSSEMLSKRGASVEVARQLGDELGSAGSTERSRRSVSFVDNGTETKQTDSHPPGNGTRGALSEEADVVDEDDDFMNMEPAHVEKSWSTAGRDASSATSSGSAVDDIARAMTDGSTGPTGSVKGASLGIRREADDAPSDAFKSPPELGNGSDEGREANTVSPGALGEEGEGQKQDESFRKFREAMLAEAELVATQGGSVSGAGVDEEFEILPGQGLPHSTHRHQVDGLRKDQRFSTASAPAPETSLSDVD